jgi:hypothetical protein
VSSSNVIGVTTAGDIEEIVDILLVVVFAKPQLV